MKSVLLTILALGSLEAFSLTPAPVRRSELVQAPAVAHVRREVKISPKQHFKSSDDPVSWKGKQAKRLRARTQVPGLNSGLTGGQVPQTDEPSQIAPVPSNSLGAASPQTSTGTGTTDGFSDTDDDYLPEDFHDYSSEDEEFEDPFPSSAAASVRPSSSAIRSKAYPSATSTASGLSRPKAGSAVLRDSAKFRRAAKNQKRWA